MSTRSDTLFPYTTRFRSAACGELSELPGKRARTAPFRELVSTNLIATLRDDRIDIDVAGRPRVEQYLDVGRNVAEIFQQIGGIGGEREVADARIAQPDIESEIDAANGLRFEVTIDRKSTRLNSSHQ